MFGRLRRSGSLPKINALTFSNEVFNTVFIRVFLRLNSAYDAKIDDVERAKSGFVFVLWRKHGDGSNWDSRLSPSILEVTKRAYGFYPYQDREDVYSYSEIDRDFQTGVCRRFPPDATTCDKTSDRPNRNRKDEYEADEMRERTSYPIVYDVCRNKKT